MQHDIHAAMVYFALDDRFTTAGRGDWMV